MYTITNETAEKLNNNFSYHSPVSGQNERYEAIRAFAKEFAEYVVVNTPQSREQSVALTKLEEVVFWANASIARNEKVAA